MTKIVVQPNASGTGTFTIAAPNSSNTQTLTLPDVTGTLLTSTGDGSALTGVGKVLQVVNATFGSGYTTSSPTRADTGLTASITPTNTANKVLVFVSLAGNGASGGTGSGPYAQFTLMRGATDLLRFEGEQGYTANTAVNSTGSTSTTYLDSPNTTSSTTYKVQAANPAGTGIIGINNSACVSTITLMEIAG